MTNLFQFKRLNCPIAFFLDFSRKQVIETLSFGTGNWQVCNIKADFVVSISTYFIEMWQMFLVCAFT